MSSPPPSQTVSARAVTAPRGTWLVVGLLLLGVAAAITGVWFQRHQTRRCLEFYGPAAARRIAAAPTVELLLVQPGAGPGRLAAHTRIDVSKAPGLVHLRRGLVEDANFNWQGNAAGDSEAAPTRLQLEAWDVAIVFSEPGGSQSAEQPRGQGRTTLVIDFAPSGGALALVGKPGRIGLGRIGPGLEKWIRSTVNAVP
jgi:hypothetical protein